MRRTLTPLLALALLLTGLSAPVAARQATDLAPLLDTALAAKAMGSERATQALSEAPGQNKEDKFAQRLAKAEERLARFAEMSEGQGSERSMEVHAILAAGCNPGRGVGKKLGHAKEGHKFAACAVSDLLPPGQEKERPAGDDDPDEDPDD